jgi:hypothetical protein
MYVFLMFVYVLIFSSIFAVFLPRLVNEKSSDKESTIQKMKALYSMELIGFAAGFAIVEMSWNKGVTLLFPFNGFCWRSYFIWLCRNKFGPQLLFCWQLSVATL